MSQTATVVRHQDAHAMAEAVADAFVARAQKVLAAGHDFTCALSGGSTPKPIYGLLAQEPRRSTIDWSRVHVFFADERCVPPTDERSNFRMVSEILLSKVALAPDHVHRIVGEGEPARAAASYEQELRRVLGAGALDFVLLGMGSDAHTASLFPGSPPAPSAWVVSAKGPLAMRVSLTEAVLNRAVDVRFAVAGEDKSARVREVLQGPFDPVRLPAQRIAPVAGTLVWHLDATAAAALT